MGAFVDTSGLVRYLTGDPPEMLPAARSAGAAATVYSFDERFPAEVVEVRAG